MKNRFWVATAAVALAGVLALPVVAQEPQGRGAGRMGMGIGQGPGGRGPGGGPMALLRGVQLTDAQREQIRAIHQEAREGAAARTKGRELQRDLRQAILADTPDHARLETLRQAIATHQAEALAKRIDVQTRIAQVLTPEQRAQARQRAEAGPAGRGGRGRAGRGVGR